MTRLFLCCGKFDSHHHFILEAETAEPEKEVVFLMNCSDTLSSFGSVVRPHATDSAVDTSVDTYKMI